MTKAVGNRPPTTLSAAALKEILDALPAALFVKDANSRIVLMNHRCEEQWGVDFAEIVGTDGAAAFPATQLQKLLEADRKVFDDGIPIEIEETVWNAKRNCNQFVHTTKSPSYDAQGKPRFLAGMSIDFANKKRVEAQLEASETKLRKLFYLSPLGIGLTDMTGRFVQFNRAFERICGYAHDELLALDYWDLTPKEYLPQEMQHLEMLQTKGYYGPYEKEYVRKDGSRIPLRLNGVLITGPDGDQYIWSIVEDISAAKKTEALLFESDERFSHLVNSIPQMVWTASVDGNLVFANQKLLQFLGTPTNDPAVVQRALFEALSPAGSSALADAWNRHVQTTPAELNVELQAMRYDGEYRWLDLHAVPIQNQDGQLTHWIGTLTDVSERRLADLNLRESQKLEAIGSLTGGLAHDFNNLLGIVLGNLDMLTAAHLEPKAAAQVQVALAAAERGAELTKSLLALAQGQSATPTPTSLNALLKRMEPLLVHTAGVRVKLALNFELKEAIAWVDSAALESSLLNLVLNARDAMPQGGELSIILRTPSKLEAFELLHGPYATLEVVDTGCGMTPEVTRKATHPFFTTKERGRGTGLGLAMVEGFAHQAAGRLRIHSKVGEGTSVQLTLPLTGMPIPENSPRMADAVLPASNLARVLIVDDEELLLDILSIWLTDAGYAVRVCTSGDQAWVALQTDMPDFLITDVVMPGTIDGLELARRARLLAPHLRILVVSGFPSQGAGDVAPRPWPMLSKPCRRDDLLKMLQQM